MILNKNPSAIRTVVNKVGNIETEFRTFPLEVIAGEANFEVTLKESNALFHFNFAEVYWNSRLQMEHLRMITKIRNTAATKNSSSPHIVADMMGGVGPFAIPLALTNVQNTTNQSKKDNSTGNGGSSAAKKSSGAPIMVHANGKFILLDKIMLPLTKPSLQLTE